MNIAQIEKITIEALQSAKRTHDALGLDGLAMIQKNQHGETALAADIACERAVLDTLKRRNVPITVHSEEHGIVVFGNQYTGVLDGIDGTSVYKGTRCTGRYGTMFAIFEGDNPSYDEYLACGVMEHVANTLFLGVRGRGAVRIKGEEISPIHVAGITALRRDDPILIDHYWEMVRKTFATPLKDFLQPATGSSAISYVSVASGDAGLALECTRKGNLEIAVAYGLIKEAGGVMVTLDGNDIGREKYLVFGQSEHVPIITASTKILADDLMRFLSDKPE